MPVTVSGRIDGKYEIVSLLGSGAMGEVYRAVDRKMFDRTVAIKFLSERLTDSADGRTRFRQEVETSALLHHPNIVTIYDWGEHQGRDYFVMEFVDGTDLQGLIRSGVPWSLEQRLDVAFQLADALDFAHGAERRVIHRDVKPSNVMVVASSAGPRVKLLDFGIARVESSTLTQTQSQPGTYSYMSPEQLRGEKLDPRSDLFSLGIVLCELFSGHHPFEAKSDAMVTHRVLFDAPEPPSRHGADVPPEVEALILRMLEKDPADRPSTARDVADALRECSRTVMLRSAGDPAVSVLEDLRRELTTLAERRTGAEREPEARAPQSESPTGGGAPSPEARERREFIALRMGEIDSALDAGKIDESVAILTRILRKYPDDTVAARMLDDLIRAAQEEGGYRDYRALVREARATLAAGDRAAASTLRDRARTLWPGGAELTALDAEILSSEREARREEEAEDARAREQEEADRRLHELLERSLDEARSRLSEARAVERGSREGVERAARSLARTVSVLDLVLCQAPDHSAARSLRQEVLRELGALEEVRRAPPPRPVPPPGKEAPASEPPAARSEPRPEPAPSAAPTPETPPRPTRRGRLGPIAAAASVLIPLIVVGAIAVRRTTRDPWVEQLDDVLKLREDSESRVSDKIKRLRAIDALLPEDDRRKSGLAPQAERLGNLLEMYNFVTRLEDVRSEAGRSHASKLIADARDLSDLFDALRAKLAADDPTATELENRRRSLVSDIAGLTGSGGGR